MNKRIILASASPRRWELLAQIGLDFEVVVSETEEEITSTEPAKVVEELSAQKAESVWEKLAENRRESAMADTIVLGADTVVACDGKILGKPVDIENAVAMLCGLQGRAHEVYTGVTVLYEENGKKKAVTFHEKTIVYFCSMTEAQIREYAATGDPLDKAGAYGIQGLCARYIRGIEGDYNNVVGLPAGRVYRELYGLGLI